MAEKICDMVTGELTLDYFVRRAQEGWKLASVEWIRGDGAVAGKHGSLLGLTTEPPYGLRLGEGESSLEESPFETAVLLLILKRIVQEKRLSEIADELNLRGYQQRGGQAWSTAAVFELMPRLVEAGPALLKSAAWQENVQ